MRRTKNDTIYAPLTTINSSKGSPIALIRVSGFRTEHVIKQITNYKVIIRKEEEKKEYLKDKIKIVEPRKATLTKIYNRFDNNIELLDIGLLLWFPGPNSYTGEDSCEFHLHGSQSIQSALLSVLGSVPGLRPAEAGEFTRRAVLNGKMSLIEAESLPDLLSSKTAFQRRLALKGLSGSTKDKYNNWMSELVDILAHLEASIDFGEDELIGEREVVDNCIRRIAFLHRNISDFIQFSGKSRDFIQTGARVAILGKPNSGKSTFMNLLSKSDRSIVSDLSGTTRDVIEHSFEFGGHAITLCDTAGLKDFSKIETDDCVDILEKHNSIEREGIRRAINTALNANIIIYIIDATSFEKCDYNEIACNISREIQKSKEVFNEGHKYVHIVINKIDLNKHLQENISCDTLSKVLKAKLCTLGNDFEFKIDLISCKSGQNFKLFSDQLMEHLNMLAVKNVGNQMVDNNYNSLEYVNERHLSLLGSAQRHLYRASKLNLVTIDEMAQHVRESLDYMSRIVGSITNEEVIDVIFRDFCIGK